MRLFAGRWNHPGHHGEDGLPSGGTAVWNDGTVLRRWGNWHSREARTVATDKTSLAVFGQCLADDKRIAADLALTLRDGRHERLTRWPGAYAVLVSSPQRLTVMTDVAGQYPVFYREDAAGVLFASSAAAVRQPGPVEADGLWLTAGIVSPSALHGAGTRSAFAGVRRLSGGRALTISSQGVSEATFEPLAPTHSATVDNCADELSAVLDEAVRSRALAAREPTADFSGGLDSTSVAFLALPHVPNHLPAFTYDNPVAPAGDDLAQASRLAALDHRLDHHVVAGGRSTLAYQDLSLVPVSDEPNLDAANIARTRARLAALTATGSDLHLTGDGGDIVMAAPYAYLADLAARRHPVTLARHSAAWARLRFRPQTAVIATALRAARTSPAQALHTLAEQLRQPSPAPAERLWEDTIAPWGRPGVEATWLTDGARKELVQHLHDQADATVQEEGLGLGDLVARSDLASYAVAHRILRENAESAGVHLHAPFLDNEVVRAGLRVPAYRRADPYAPKRLLAQALRHQIPAQVFVRRTKGNYTGEEYQGIRLAKDTLRALFTDPLTAHLGLVDPDPVRTMIDNASIGLRVPFAALNRLLAVELWLRHQHGLPLLPEEPSGA